MSHVTKSEPEGFLGVDDEVLRSLVDGVVKEPPTSLRLTVGIGTINMTVPEICRASAGDLLPLERFVNEVVVTFEDVTLYRGEIVVSEEKIFLRIRNAELDRVDSEGSEGSLAERRCE